MRNYVERAKDFIAEVFPYLEKMTPWDVEEQIEVFNSQYHRAVKVNHGIARIALITSDYVVKFDYDEDEVEGVGGGANEVTMYANAQREGMAHLFAQITAYKYNDCTFYIMPLVRGVGSGHWYAEHYMNPQERDFCRKYKLSDLHSNNYGFVKGHVCLIDYACCLPESTSEYDEYLVMQSSPCTWS